MSEFGIFYHRNGIASCAPCTQSIWTVVFYTGNIQTDDPAVRVRFDGAALAVAANGILCHTLRMAAPRLCCVFACCYSVFAFSFYSRKRCDTLDSYSNITRKM